jgi:histidine ammonia-lyase
MKEKTFNYGKDSLTVNKAIDIVNGKIIGIINQEAGKQIQKSSDAVNTIVKNKKTVYGVNTGFGSLCQTTISEEDTKKLQYNILRSHSAGVGKIISNKTAKLMLILKVHALSFGFSGARRETLDRILWHINNDIIPIVPSQGSVGASGDLVPLSHLFLPLIGLGSVHYKGEIVRPRICLRKKTLALLN